MVGLASSSVIFIDTDCDPLSAADAPETPSIVTVAVSKDELPSVSPEVCSRILSSVGVNDAVPVVEPAEIVMFEIVL